MKKTKLCLSIDPKTELPSYIYGVLTCAHCQGLFRRRSGPAATYGGVRCRVAAHRKEGKAAAEKVLKKKLRAKARR